MRFDWFVHNAGGRRTLFVPRANVASITPSLGLRSATDGSMPPRWVVMREPQPIELGKDIEASQAAAQLFAQAGRPCRVGTWRR